MSFACYVQRRFPSKKNAFRQILTEYQECSCIQVVRAAIRGRCPCMGAKCAEIPRCPWSQPSIGSFLWSRPEEEGRVKCWGSPRRLPGCFTVEKYFHCEVTHRRALRKVVFGVKGSCRGRGSVLTNCKKAFGNLFFFFFPPS